MKYKKKTFWAFIGFLLLMAAMLGVWFFNRPAANSNLKHFQVTVIDQDDESETFDFASAEEYLGPALLAEDFIQGEEGPYGLYITHVNGLEAASDQNAWWRILENGAEAATGADAIVLQDGAVYTFEYALFE